MSTGDERNPDNRPDTGADHLDDRRPEHDSTNPALEDEPTPDEPPARPVAEDS